MSVAQSYETARRRRLKWRRRDGVLATDAKVLYPAGMTGCSWEVAGSNANAYETDPDIDRIDFDASDNAAALLIV